MPGAGVEDAVVGGAGAGAGAGAGSADAAGGVPGSEPDELPNKPFVKSVESLEPVPRPSPVVDEAAVPLPALAAVVFSPDALGAAASEAAWSGGWPAGALPGGVVAADADVTLVAEPVVVDDPVGSLVAPDAGAGSAGARGAANVAASAAAAAFVVPGPAFAAPVVPPGGEPGGGEPACAGAPGGAGGPDCPVGDAAGGLVAVVDADDPADMGALIGAMVSAPFEIVSVPKPFPSLPKPEYELGKAVKPVVVPAVAAGSVAGRGTAAPPPTAADGVEPLTGVIPAMLLSYPTQAVLRKFS